MVEFAIAVPLLFIIIFTMIEIGRFGLIKLLLVRSTIETLNFVQKAPDFDADTRNCVTSPCAELDRLTQARSEAVVRAMRLPSMLISTDVTSNAYFEDYQVTATVAGGTAAAPPEMSQVLILRPGEVGRNISTGRTISHPSLCASYDGSCPGTRPKLVAATPWRDAIRNNSIVVEMSARVRPLLPIPYFAGGFTLRAGVSAPRETPALIRLTPSRPAAVSVVPPPTPAPTTCPGAMDVVCGDDCVDSTCPLCEAFDMTDCSCHPIPAYEICGASCVPQCGATQIRAGDGSCKCCGFTTTCLAYMCRNLLYPPLNPPFILAPSCALPFVPQGSCLAYDFVCS